MHRFQRFIKLIALLVVLGAVVLGFIVAGSPQRARELRADAERLQDFEQIRSGINNFFTAEGVLPKSLDELKASGRLFAPEATLADPLTKEPYGYRALTDTTFELCATFSAPSEPADRGDARPMPAYPAAPPGKETFVSWDHPAGRHCFTIEAVDFTVERP